MFWLNRQCDFLGNSKIIRRISENPGVRFVVFGGHVFDFKLSLVSHENHVNGFCYVQHHESARRTDVKNTSFFTPQHRQGLLQARLLEILKLID